MTTVTIVQVLLVDLKYSLFLAHRHPLVVNRNNKLNLKKQKPEGI